MPLDVNASSVNNITDIVDFTTPVLATGDSYTTFTCEKTELAQPAGFKTKTITICPQVDTSTIDIDPYKTYCVYLMSNRTGATISYSGGGSPYNLTVDSSTIVYYDINGKYLTLLQGSSPYTYRGYALVEGIELLNGYTSSDNSTCNFTCKVGWNGTQIVNGGGYSGQFIYSFPYNLTIYNMREGYEYMNTTDMETKRQIQHSEEIINDTLVEGNDIASDTNTTTHSIFDSITSFFGSFFSNLIGVFVPESGYFETWFSRVNTMLSDKLGILYYPFSFFIDLCSRLLTAFNTQGSTCVIHFPTLNFTMNGTTYTIIQGQDVDLASYSLLTGRAFTSADTSNSSIVGTSGFTSFTQVIRRISSIVFVLGFLSLLRRKLNLIIRGVDNDN